MTQTSIARTLANKHRNITLEGRRAMIKSAALASNSRFITFTSKSEQNSISEDYTSTNYAVAGATNSAAASLTPVPRENWLTIDLFGQLYAQREGAKRGSKEWNLAYAEGLLLCGVTSDNGSEFTFTSQDDEVTLSEICVEVMGDVIGGDAAVMMSIAMKGLKDTADGYNIFSSSSKSETGQGYLTSLATANDEYTANIVSSSYNWVATIKKSDWFWIKRQSTTVHITYSVDRYTFNYDAYNDVKDLIKEATKNYRRELIQKLIDEISKPQKDTVIEATTLA